MGLKNWLAEIGFPLLDKRAIAGLILFWILVFSVGGCLLVGMSQRLSLENDDEIGLLPRTATTTQTATRQLLESEETEIVLSPSPVFLPGELTGMPLTQTADEWLVLNPPTQTPLFFTEQPTRISTNTRVPTATWVIYSFTRIVPTSYYRTSTPRPTQTATHTRTPTFTNTATTTVPTTHIPTLAPTSTMTMTPTGIVSPTLTATETPTPTGTETVTVTVTSTATVVSTVIAFSGDFNDPIGGQDLTMDLLRVDSDGSNFARILADGDDAFMGDWSPAGDKIVYEVRQVDSVRLYTVAANGTAKTLLTNQPDGKNSQPQWSPNGKWIVQVNQHPERDSGAANLWITPADGSPSFVLTSGIDQDTQPSWSPDGKKIVFVRNTLIYTLNVEEIDQDGFSPQAIIHSLLNLFLRSAATDAKINATPQPLFDDAVVQGDWPRYSPDGKYLLLVRSGNVLRLDLNDRNELNLTEGLSGAAREPAWSSDGKMIACVIRSIGEPQRDEIWLISVTGENRSQLPLQATLLEKHRPVWQP